MKPSFLNRKRSPKGSFIAEAPVALWLLFFMFTIPFLDLATVLLRYTFFVSAVRDGVHAAAQAKTYLINSSATNQSAVNIAPASVATTANAFSEISVNNVQTVIVETRLSDLRVMRYSAPLSAPADQAAYLYEIETVVQGTINPLMNMNIGILPPIPGLTAGVPVTVAAREYCEFPEGLNQ